MLVRSTPVSSPFSRPVFVASVSKQSSESTLRSTNSETSLNDRQSLDRLDRLQFQQLRIEEVYGHAPGSAKMDRNKSSDSLKNYVDQLPQDQASEGREFLENYFLMYGN